MKALAGHDDAVIEESVFFGLAEESCAEAFGARDVAVVDGSSATVPLPIPGDVIARLGLSQWPGQLAQPR
jgi:hypothetical protein